MQGLVFFSILLSIVAFNSAKSASINKKFTGFCDKCQSDN